MIPLDDLLTATGAELLAPSPYSTFGGFAHDSRAVAPSECFVAVAGLHGDGHDYLAEAAEHGASAVVIERARRRLLERAQPGLLGRLERAGVAVLLVEDTRAALQQYAEHILAAWRPLVIAITGGVGKTSTKEAIADVLSLSASTFRSWRNYNDLLGLPLSLGRLEPTHRYAVLELGADHPGEIADLCALIHPQVGVVTNGAPTQLQYFGSVAALCEELARLPAALPADGFAVLNSDDPATRAMSAQSPAPARFFGLHANDAITLRYAVLPDAPDLTLLPLDGGITGESIRFPHLHGDHWAYAVLAALTLGEALDVSPDRALATLCDFTPLPGRMRLLAGRENSELLDDSHNATPTSAAAGLAALVARARHTHRKRIAVLGDMLRLGDAEHAAHEELGRLAAVSTDYLVTQGDRAVTLADAARQCGMPADAIAVTHTAEDAAHAALTFAAASQEIAGASPIVYIKGSEEMRMERVTGLLLAQPEQAETLLDRQTAAWRRVVVMRPDRPTWLEIDLSAIGANTRLIKDYIGPNVRLLISLKADAYGHGALRVARTALNNGARWLGVATVSEAIPLRAAGIEAPTLIFGYIPPWQARDAVRLDLRATVYGVETAQALSHAAGELDGVARVHVKVDTGMARLGLRADTPEDVAAIVRFVAELRALPHLEVEGIFTHFATADSADQTYQRRQFNRFQSVLAALDATGLRPGIVHASNSAATLAFPEAHFDMVRVGIAIYGLNPSDETPLPAGFRPALAFKTQVAQVKDIPAGEGVSYGATFITPRPMRIATLPVGYADGFRRGPHNWGEVLVRGQRAPLLGRVAMDQCMVDVSHIPGVAQGDEVVLIGRQGADAITADEVAQRLGTISYEVVSELLARVPRLS